MVYKDKYNEIFTVHRFESGDMLVLNRFYAVQKKQL